MLNVTRASIDNAAGVQPGYSGKKLGRRAVRSAIGKTTFGPMLTALGVMLVLVEDPTAFKFTKQHEAKKKRHAGATMPTRENLYRQ